jgi:restriction system protein
MGGGEQVTQNSLDARLPSHVTMAWPALCAIKRAGGSASNEEIMEAVAKELDLDDRQRSLRLARGSRNVLGYRLAWTRTFLKNMGAITNDGRGRWSVTEIGRHVTPSDIQIVSKKQLTRLRKTSQSSRG